MFLLVFYGIYLLIAAAVAVLAFRSIRKRGVGRALLGTILSVALLGLFLPIPIHAGFTFLIEVMVQELRSTRVRVEQAERSERKEAFLRKLAARFRGRLAVPPQPPATETELSSVELEGGSRVWYDARSGLAWTDMLELDGSTPPDLEQATAFCSGVEPKGHWALPTEAELSLFWKAGGYRVSPLGGYGTVGLLENVDFQTEMLSMRTSRNGAFALRCVALGPAAPAGGYLSGDIPLDEWNEYQLQKSVPGFPGPGDP